MEDSMCSTHNVDFFFSYTHNDDSNCWDLLADNENKEASKEKDKGELTADSCRSTASSKISNKKDTLHFFVENEEISKGKDKEELPDEFYKKTASSKIFNKKDSQFSTHNVDSFFSNTYNDDGNLWDFLADIENEEPSKEMDEGELPGNSYRTTASSKISNKKDPQFSIHNIDSFFPFTHNDDSTLWGLFADDKNEVSKGKNKDELSADLCRQTVSSNIANKENTESSKLPNQVENKFNGQEMGPVTKVLAIKQDSCTSSQSQSKPANASEKSSSYSKSVFDDDDDEFWDFLKSSHDGHRAFTNAELEEIKNLSSITPCYEFNFSSSISATPNVEFNIERKTSLADDCRDLDSIFSRLNATLGRMGKNYESNQQLQLKEQMFGANNQTNNHTLHSNENNSIETSVAEEKVNSDRNQCQLGNLRNDSQVVSSSCESQTQKEKSARKFQQKINRSKVRRSLKNKTFINGVLKTDLNSIGKNKGTNKTILEDVLHDRIIDAGTDIFDFVQNQTKFADCVAQTDVPADKEHTHSALKHRNSDDDDLPIISDCFSLASWPSDTDEQVLLNRNNTNHLTDFNGITATKSSAPDSIDHNITPPQIKNTTSFNLNSGFQINTSSPTIKSKNKPSLKHKNPKRILPQGSPKNSIFRVVDSATDQYNKFDAATTVYNNVTNRKRQKSCEIINNPNVAQQENLLQSNDKNNPCSVQAKNMQNATNSIASVSNTTPLYLIIPHNSDLQQNKNGELLMVINNNHLIQRNLESKMIPRILNLAVPVSTIKGPPGTWGTQTLSTNQPSTENNFQQISMPTVYVENLSQVSETSNCLRSTVIHNPSHQNVVNEVQNPNIPLNSHETHINTIPVSISQSGVQTFYTNVNKIAAPSNIDASAVSQAQISTLSKSSIQLPCENSEVTQLSVGGIPGLLAMNMIQPHKIMHSISSIPIQPSMQVKQEIFKPLKNIQLGKDKNAVQQISVPLKIENIIGSTSSNYIHNNFLISSIPSNLCKTKLLTTQAPSNIVHPTYNVWQTLPTITRQQNKVYNFVPYKSKTDKTLVKRNLITNEYEIMAESSFPCPQSENSTNLGKTLSGNGVNMHISNPKDEEKILCSLNSTTTTNPQLVLGSVNRNEIHSLAPTKISEICPESQDQHGEIKKDALRRFQELFPPPISMVPVNVVPPLNTNKPSVSKVLVREIPKENISETELSKNKIPRKGTFKKGITVKTKKPALKTVKQLLEERKIKSAVKITVILPQPRTKLLTPIFSLKGNGVLIPTAIPISINRSLANSSSAINAIDTRTSNTLIDKSYKRPNIMILPSAMNSAKKKVLKSDSGKIDIKNFHASQTIGMNDTPVFDTSQDSIFDEMMDSKDYRPRYYDMCELHIGYFKVEDDVDPADRFRSKFKVLFRKRMFMYEFPLTKCNSVELKNSYSLEQTACIQVPFASVVALNMSKRYVNIQLNKYPQVHLKNVQEQAGHSTEETNTSNTSVENSIWSDSMRNSLIHKVVLRKCQADNLKSHLCQIDQKFLLLFRMGDNIGSAIFDASPFEKELNCASLRKNYLRNKRNMVRRLPHWDSEDILDVTELMDQDPTMSSKHVCSCRISCRSLRCSCAKAAKSCGSGGSVCACNNCDNPLNILESLGMDLGFSLRDCCLFQNIYQVPKLREYLQCDVKLSCCNTVAHVFDCIPGTLLCPNTECNATLEFSWCRGVICYPERNPRNHCSICGLCCFSNGHHCQVCNRCYIVSPKCSACPNCRGSGFALNPICNDFYANKKRLAADSLVNASTKKPHPKPEIILLGSSANAKSESKLLGEVETMDDKDSGVIDEECYING